MRASNSSLYLDGQSSLSLGPAFTLQSGILLRVFLVTSSTIVEDLSGSDARAEPGHQQPEVEVGDY